MVHLATRLLRCTVSDAAVVPGDGTMTTAIGSQQHNNKVDKPTQCLLYTQTKSKVNFMACISSILFAYEQFMCQNELEN